MAGLGDTVNKLSRLKRGLDAGAHMSERKMEEVRGFGSNPGALRMLTYAPEALPPGAPLVVVLHGCTQQAEAHAAAAGWLTLADRLGFAVLAPEQVSANNPNRCFNWFEPSDTARGAGEAASIRAMVERCLKERELDSDRVFVTGLSAGGAMAAVMLATYPEVFAAGAVIAGLPFGVARNVQEALSLMHAPQTPSGNGLGALVQDAAPKIAALPKITIWHGDADRTVDHRNGVLLARQWASASGFQADPDNVEALQGRVRLTWRSRSGEAVIELNMVHGLGHGTPLASGGEDGLGAPGPYMLEAGVSSSLEVARFWGLAPASPELTAVNDAKRAIKAPAQAPRSRLGATVMSALSSHVPRDVQSTIERALKTAGLM